MNKPAIITLLTDFGLKDGYPGIMKGVIWQIAPGCQVADLTHEITPQNILEGALAIGRACSYFPAGTIHVGVVDPGVGTERRPIAARLGQHYFVGPDNGLFTLPLQAAEAAGQTVAAVHLDQAQYWLPQVSASFHGRDIFAPVAAHLANGTLLDELGTRIDNLQRIHIPHPQPTEYGWQANINHIDHFGNLSTNLNINDLAGRQVKEIRCAGISISELSRAYGDHPDGELVALIDSSGALSIAIVNGNAAARLNAQIGQAIQVILS